MTSCKRMVAPPRTAVHISISVAATSAAGSYACIEHPSTHPHRRIPEHTVTRVRCGGAVELGASARTPRESPGKAPVPFALGCGAWPVLLLPWSSPAGLVPLLGEVLASPTRRFCGTPQHSCEYSMLAHGPPHTSIGPPRLTLRRGSTCGSGSVRVRTGVAGRGRGGGETW